MSKSLKHYILAYARNIIANEKHWTDGAFARTKDGEDTHPLDYDAYRFCAQGALWRANYELTGSDRRPTVLSRHRYNQLGRTNECKGHAAVLKLYDKLIEGA